MEECFEDNVVICNQDEMGDKFYLIKDGTAVCTQKGLDGEFRKVLELSTGAYFGEVSVVVIMFQIISPQHACLTQICF